MPTRSQRVITTPTGKIGPTDLSRTVYLRGNALLDRAGLGPDDRRGRVPVRPRPQFGRSRTQSRGLDLGGGVMIKRLALALAMALALTGCKTWPFGAKTSGPDVCCLAGPCSGGEQPCE